MSFIDCYKKEFFLTCSFIFYFNIGADASQVEPIFMFFLEFFSSQVKESDGILVSEFDGTYRWVLTDLYY